MAARYPRDSVSRAGVPENEEEALLAQEQEKEMDDERQELFVLLRNTSKLIPKQSIASVHTLLQSFIQPGTFSWAHDPLTLLLSLSVCTLTCMCLCVPETPNAAAFGGCCFCRQISRPVVEASGV